MKKSIRFASWLAAAAMALNLTACQSAPASSQQADAMNSTQQPLRIVTTIFPEYDWVRNILGDKADEVELTLLMKDGVDLHSFQPTAADMMTIANADLLIHVGGISDEWVQDALENQGNPNRQVLALTQVLGDAVKNEEVVEGMEEHDHDHHHEEEAHAHEEEHGHEEEHHEHEELDEHVWLSLKNAQVLCQAITDALCQLDSENAAQYQANAAAYTEKLQALDGEYAQMVSTAQRGTLLFADRFPFRYLVDDYGLNYYAAFVGCSAETEASFATVAFLAEKTDELNLGTVLTIDNAQHKIADTVIASTKSQNQQILSMNSMQAVTSQQMDEGASYLGIMEQNLEVLRQALN